MVRAGVSRAWAGEAKQVVKQAEDGVLHAMSEYRVSLAERHARSLRLRANKDGEEQRPGLHFVAAHLVVVQVFEPAAQILRAERGAAVGGAAGMLEDLRADEDGAVGAKRQRDRVGRASVERDDFAGAGPSRWWRGRCLRAASRQQRA